MAKDSRGPEKKRKMGDPEKRNNQNTRKPPTAVYTFLNNLTKQTIPFFGRKDAHKLAINPKMLVYRHFKSMGLITIFAFFYLPDAFDAYNCIKLLTPIAADWTEIKHDENVRKKAEKIFIMGRVKLSVQQVINNWEKLEKTYYGTNELYEINPESNKLELKIPKTSLADISTNVNRFIFESIVLFFMQFSKLNYFWYRNNYPNPRNFQKYFDSSFKSDSIYPQPGWYRNLSDLPVDDKYIKETYIVNFEKRLKYEKIVSTDYEKEYEKSFNKKFRDFWKNLW